MSDEEWLPVSGYSDIRSFFSEIRTEILQNSLRYERLQKFLDNFVLKIARDFWLREQNLGTSIEHVVDEYIDQFKNKESIIDWVENHRPHVTYKIGEPSVCPDAFVMRAGDLDYHKLTLRCFLKEYIIEKVAAKKKKHGEVHIPCGMFDNPFFKGMKDEYKLIFETVKSGLGMIN